jgi:hypothetical protein
MADVTIEGTASASNWKAALRSQAWTSATTGYQFFIDNSSDLIYRKTTDNGATWGAKVTVRTGSLQCFDIWFEKWTPGDSGTKILCAYNDTGTDDTFFRTLDTASDTLGTETVAFAGLTYAALLTGTWDQRCISITKARGGNIYILSNPDTTAEIGFYRSVDAGVNWTSRNIVSAGVSGGPFALLPANTSDTQDVVALLFVAAGGVSAKVYDDSGNTWDTTSIDAAYTGSTSYTQMGASIRHSDNHIIAAIWSELDASTADLTVWDLNPSANGANGTSKTQKTNIITNTAEYAQCCVFIDQTTNDIWVGVLGGATWATDAYVLTTFSIDGGATWSPLRQHNTTLDDMRAVWCDLGSSVTDAPFAPTYQNDDLDDIYVNANNVLTRPYSAAWSFQNFTSTWMLRANLIPYGLRIVNGTAYDWDCQFDDTVTTNSHTVTAGTTYGLAATVSVTIDDALFTVQMLPIFP